MSEERVQRKLERAEKKVAILEAMIEDKTRQIYLAKQTAEAALERLRNVHRTMPSALLTVDAEGAIADANTAAHEMLGQPAGDLAGVRPSRWLAPNREPSFHQLFASCAAGEVVRTEHALLSADGTEVPVLLSASGYSNPGAARGLVVVAFDIRDRMRLEADLRQAQKLEAVGQLATGVAHEINTPAQYVSDSIFFLEEMWGEQSRRVTAYQALADSAESTGVLAGALQDLTDATGDIDVEGIEDEVPPTFQRVHEGLEQVGRIVRALMDFAQADATEPVPLDLVRSLEDALAISRGSYRDVARLETDLQPVPKVLCHPQELGQVLLNLITNAADAIEERRKSSPIEGVLRVSVKSECDGALVGVSDNGSGIPPAVQERMFEPFFTTKPVGSGAGQGLAVCHGIVARAGGSIWFETTEGEGTTFYVWLPPESNNNAVCPLPGAQQPASQ